MSQKTSHPGNQRGTFCAGPMGAGFDGFPDGKGGSYKGPPPLTKKSAAMYAGNENAFSGRRTLRSLADDVVKPRATSVRFLFWRPQNGPWSLILVGHFPVEPGTVPSPKSGLKSEKVWAW